MIGRLYLDECLLQLRRLKKQSEKAIAQVDDEQFFTLIDPDANSIALIMKHVAGNMRSLWTDFLTTDGEKPDRDRDSEFERRPEESREAILERWEGGWSRTLGTISALAPEDLAKTVTIRGEVHTVLQAISRQVSHYSLHAGQIVMLAKHLAGPRWQTLSIPKKK